MTCVSAVFLLVSAVAPMYWKFRMPRSARFVLLFACSCRRLHPFSFVLASSRRLEEISFLLSKRIIRNSGGKVIPDVSAVCTSVITLLFSVSYSSILVGRPNSFQQVSGSTPFLS